MKKRVLSLVCVLSILVSLCVVPVSAVDELVDDYSKNRWSQFCQTGDMHLLNTLVGVLGVEQTAESVFWRYMDSLLILYSGPVSSLSWLRNRANQLDTLFNQPLNGLPNSPLSIPEALGRATLLFLTWWGNGHEFLDFEVVFDDNFDVYRIQEVNSGLWVTDSTGHFPYVSADGEDVSEVGGNKWVGERSCSTTIVNMQDYNTLAALNAMLIQSGTRSQLRKLGNYIAIWYNNSYYCDANGYPFVCWADEASSATNQTRPDTQISDGSTLQDAVAGNSTNIDIGSMIVTLPDGTTQFIDNLYYDESNKTYNVDASTTIYEGDTNNYYTYNYSYEWTYHVNYTSITYIGQTEEYNKYYEVYYELPDGRDSADLTREELEQLNLDIDVVPYGRSTDNTSLRSLYHFDGDTKDSSYWNHTTKFSWNKGASLTYMDAGIFNGALYLDETEHDFTITLPSGIGAGSFTLQFRYYQSHTPAPVNDSYIQIGDKKILQLDGDAIRNGSGTTLTEMPIGTWNELAVIRTGVGGSFTGGGSRAASRGEPGVMYFYLNGVCIGSVDDQTAYGKEITFHFGSQQQTYKYFDELRILNYDLAVGGNYEPSSVPHDTNLTLVLPTDSTPVADEYWSITSTGENLFQYDMAAGTASGLFQKAGFGDGMFDTIYAFRLGNPQYPAWGYSPKTINPISMDGYTSIEGLAAGKGFYAVTLYEAGDMGPAPYFSNVYDRGLSSCLWYYAQGMGVPDTKENYLPDGTYTLSVVLGDGSISSFTFTTQVGTALNDHAVFEWGSIGVDTYNGSSYGVVMYQNLYIEPNAGTTIDIRHIELIAGDSTDLKAEYVSGIVGLSPDQLNSPTLAVRTDIPITGYQIGGVRPSIPKKGQVWAMVESQRITSIQIYNGSAWEACDGRIWTGSRWIPASSYNVVTLQDMYDIADATPDYEYIYSESGFWSWWQKSWNAFTEKLFAALDKIAAGSGGSIDAEDMPSYEDESGEWKFVDLLVVLKDGTWNLVTGIVSVVFDGFAGLVSVVSDGTSVFSFFDAENENYLFTIGVEEGASVWD